MSWSVSSKTSLLLLILIVASLGYASAKRTDPCGGALPDSLRKAITVQYPDRKIVTLDMLTVIAEKIYLKDHKTGCPGVARVDFYGDRSEMYALVLTKEVKDTYISSLILGQRQRNREWRFSVIEPDVQDAPPVVFTLPPGEFVGTTSQQEQRTLASKHEAIVFVGYESWSIVYVWTGDKVEKLWLSD